MATPITPESIARTGTEHAEQAAVFCWAAGTPERRKQLRWMYAIPNGGGRSMQQGLALKAEGVKGGVADICLPMPMLSYGFHGLYIEMKKANGIPSDVREDQLEFGANVTLRGYAWYVAFGWKEAVHLIECYLVGMNPPLSERQRKVHENMMQVLNESQ